MEIRVENAFHGTYGFLNIDENKGLNVFSKEVFNLSRVLGKIPGDLLYITFDLPEGFRVSEYSFNEGVLKIFVSFEDKPSVKVFI